MVLREKLNGTKMSKTDTVTSYLIKISQVHDELSVVGEEVKDDELLRTTLNGFSKKWDLFVKGVVVREKLPDCHRLLDDFSQEETWEEALQGCRAKGDENEENVSLYAKKGRDMSKVKCFACHKIDLYAIQCPNKKGKETQVATSTSTEIDDFAKKFKKEFYLVACLLGNGNATFGDIRAWFVDTGSSRHMMGIKSMFLNVSETNLDCHVGCGTTTMHVVKGVGCVRFQLES